MRWIWYGYVLYGNASLSSLVVAMRYDLANERHVAWNCNELYVVKRLIAAVFTVWATGCAKSRWKYLVAFASLQVGQALDSPATNDWTQRSDTWYHRSHEWHVPFIRENSLGKLIHTGLVTMATRLVLHCCNVSSSPLQLILWLSWSWSIKSNRRRRYDKRWS
jgi:hypothetical protein